MEGSAMSDATILERLAKIGDGDARKGFGFLCVKAEICSVCLERWDSRGDCSCIREPVEAVAR